MVTLQVCPLSAGGWQRQGQVRCARRLRRPLTPPAARGVLATIAGKLRFPAYKAIQVWLARRDVNTCGARSEEHTSELQSLRHLVCRLLLEKKNKAKSEIVDV